MPTATTRAASASRGARLTRWLLALAVALAPVAQAGVSVTDDGSASVALANGPATWNDVDFDIWGDTQKQTNPGQISDGSSTYLPSEQTCQTTLACTPENCAHAPYCRKSWDDEGKRVLTNQTQASRGLDPASPARAQFVIQVGDIQDSWDVVPGLDNRAHTCPHTLMPRPTPMNEWDMMVERVYDPLYADDVALISAHGNHDFVGCYERLVADRAAASSRFHERVVDTVNAKVASAYSMIVATRAGRVCLVALPWHEPYTVEYLALLRAMVGCGEGLPTFLTKHSMVQPVGGSQGCISAASADQQVWTPTGGGTDVVDQATHPEMLFIAAGHQTGFAGSCLTRYDGVDTGEVYYAAFSNAQQVAHVGFDGGGLGLGAGPFNGGDGMILRCRISPSRGFIHCRDYDPTGHRYVSPQPKVMFFISFFDSLDWCGRFGGC